MIELLNLLHANGKNKSTSNVKNFHYSKWISFHISTFHMVVRREHRRFERNVFQLFFLFAPSHRGFCVENRRNGTLSHESRFTCDVRTFFTIHQTIESCTEKGEKNWIIVHNETVFSFLEMNQPKNLLKIELFAFLQSYADSKLIHYVVLCFLIFIIITPWLLPEQQNYCLF